MKDDKRSLCPINLALELFGDKWSLLIIRDMIFGGKRYYRELLRSEEAISTNILAERLKRLVAEGMITRVGDASHKQKAIYSLTGMAIALVPVLAHLGAWGRRYLPVSEELSIRAQLLEEGGPAMWTQFMAELREEHLGTKRRSRKDPSVRATLQLAYENLVKLGAKSGKTTAKSVSKVSDALKATASPERTPPVPTTSAARLRSSRTGR